MCAPLHGCSLCDILRKKPGSFGINSNARASWSLNTLIVSMERRRKGMNKATTVLLVCLLTLSASFVSGAENWAVSYDASLGSLPTDQGWTIAQTADNPTPYVSSGLLHQGLTSYTGGQTWHKSWGQLTDLFGSAPLVAESSFRISYSSFFQTSDWCRGGFQIALTDSYGRGVCAQFSSSGVSLINGDDQGAFFVPYDTTSAMHAYSVCVCNGVAALFADTNLLASTAVVATDWGGWNNVLSFGDGTGWGNNESSIQYVRGSIVPEPSSAIALLCGIGGLGGMVLRKKSV